MENGETEPRGDTLKRIAAALGVTPNEIMDWTVQENDRFLSNLNLSALTFLVFAPLGIIVPYILWNDKRSKVKGAEQVGREIINFQITWCLALFALQAIGVTGMIGQISSLGRLGGDVSPAGLMGLMGLQSGGMFFLFAYNLVFILVNQLRIDQGKPVRYFPKINFIR